MAKTIIESNGVIYEIGIWITASTYCKINNIPVFKLQALIKSKNIQHIYIKELDLNLIKK